MNLARQSCRAPQAGTGAAEQAVQRGPNPHLHGVRHQAGLACRPELLGRRDLWNGHGDLSDQIERGATAILRGTSLAALEARLPALEKEEASIEARLAQEAQPEPVIELHPRTAEMYAALVAELQSVLATRAVEPTAAERRLRDAVRALVYRIVLHPLTQVRGGPIDISVELTLDRLLGEHPANFGLGGVVAGGGIEPPTCGL